MHSDHTTLSSASGNRRLGTALCVGAAAIGALALIGWLTGTPALATIVPGLPPMMPNTATAVLLVGVAAGLAQQRSSSGVRRTLVVLPALAVLALGAAALVYYASGRDLGILNITQGLVRRGSATPAGQSSLPASLALTCLSSAVLLLSVRSRARVHPAEWLILFAASVSFTGLNGIIFQPPLYQLTRSPIIGLSLTTAVSVLLISLGMLLERGGVIGLAMSPGPGGVLIRRLGPVVVFLPILLGLVVARLTAASSVADVSVPVALLATSMTAVSLALLFATALPLNRAHDEVQASRRRISELVELAPDGIFVADLDGRYTDVNDAGCHLLDCSREDIIGRTIVDLIPPADIDRLQQVKEVLLQGGISVAEWTLLRRDGSYVPVEISAKILPGGRWQGFVRDIGERKRLEQEAERATRARDDLLGVVAHDLRNPLASILVEMQIIQGGGALARRVSDGSVPRIQRAAMRMHRLIQDLLDVTRMEAGQLSIQPVRLRATQLAADAAEAQKTLLSSASLELCLDLAAGLPDILGDRDRLLQTFENLIGNAIKFTPAPGVITLRGVPDGSSVRFSISDTGPGIAPEDQPHLFDRFWQGRAAKKSGAGAGLGLPIVKGIVEAHGGRVWIDSAPGRGSTFGFSIPIAPPHT